MKEQDPVDAFFAVIVGTIAIGVSEKLADWGWQTISQTVNQLLDKTAYQLR